MVRFDQSRKGPRRERQTKRWKSIFFNRRRFEDIPFFKARENIESFEREGGPLDAFLEDTESSTPSWERIVIKNFLQAQTSRATPAPTLARARLDDREHGSGEIRKNSEWLTPSQLRHALDFQVISNVFNPTELTISAFWFTRVAERGSSIDVCVYLISWFFFDSNNFRAQNSFATVFNAFFGGISTGMSLMFSLLPNISRLSQWYSGGI